MISKSISVSSKLAQVSPFAALLFTWIQPHCDDGGNMPGDPFTVKGLVVPVRPETITEVKRALNEIEKIGLIKVYEIDGSKYLHVVNFEKHQTLRKDRTTWLYPDERHDSELATERQPKGNPRGAKRREGKVREVKLSEYKIERGVKYLDNVPSKDIKEWIDRFIVTETEIKSKAEDLKLYCERRGRRYSNYRSFLLNALKRDFKERDGKKSKYDNIE